MQDFDFMMTLSRALTDNEVDALYEAGFDNSAFHLGKGPSAIDTSWAAATKSEAITKATEVLKQTVSNIEVVKVEDIS